MPDRRPWWQRIPAIAAYPLSVGGLFTCVFLGFFVWIALILGVAGLVTSFSGLVVAGLVVTTLFAAMRASANGDTRLPDWSEFRNVRNDVVAPGLKALALAVLLALPATAVQRGWLSSSADEAASKSPLDSVNVSSLLSGAAGPNLDEMQNKIAGTPAAEKTAAEPETPPMRWTAAGAALALGAAALFPLALLVLGISQSLLMALNPLVWAQILKETLADYLGVVAGLALLGGAGALATWPLAALSARVPLVPSIAADSIDVYVALCGAHMLGWFVWVNHERLGYRPETRTEMTPQRVAEIKAATLAEIERRGRSPRGPGR